MKHVKPFEGFLNEAESASFDERKASKFDANKFYFFKFKGTNGIFKTGTAYGFKNFAVLGGKLVEIEVKNKRTEPGAMHRTQCMCKSDKGWTVLDKWTEVLTLHAELEEAPGLKDGDELKRMDFTAKPGTTKFAGKYGRNAKLRKKK